MYQDAIGKRVDVGPGEIVLDEDPSRPKGADPPIFGPCLLWTNRWMDQDATLIGTEVDLDPGHIVLHADPAPQKKAYSSPQFSAHVCCGQMAGWIKMPLRVEVGLGTGNLLLDGDPAPLPKRGGALSPIFCPFLLWLNGWMHKDATWYGGRPQPRRQCVTRGLRSPSQKGGGAPLPNFRHMAVVAKRLDGSRWHLAWRWALV